MSTINLVTGTTGAAHVSSANQGAVNAALHGSGAYVSSGLTCSVSGQNVTVGAGTILVQGRHAIIESAVTLTITAGKSGYHKYVYVIAKYTNSGTAETMGIELLEGTSVATTKTASRPTVSGNILNGDSSAQIALYEIYVNGTTYNTPTKLAGDMAVSTLDEVVSAVLQKQYPVGGLYSSFKSTNPATVLGFGTWTQITGRYLRAANDTNTGGSDTITLTADQLPAHSHTYHRADTSVQHYVCGDESSPYGFLASSEGYDASSSSTGEGSAITIQPSYQDIYVWQRTK